MVLSGKLARVAAAIVIPAAAFLVAIGPASAATDGGGAKGSLTCLLASSFTFTPPLSPGIGTTGVTQEVVTMGPAVLSGCTGSITVGSLPVSGTQTKATTIKIKALKHLPGGGKAAGGCPAFLGLNWPKFKPKYGWTTGATPDAKTKASVAKGGTWGADGSLFTLTFSGTARGSFAGSVAINAVFDSASSDAFHTCIGGSPGTISSAEFDSSLSTITFTPPA
ncbi:MAG TPA: hypothetical protein VN796_12140 [Acidimicrobiales bacterium]|nr:hypothetical protein [Acidimicrobiales bacterium]